MGQKLFKAFIFIMFFFLLWKGLPSNQFVGVVILFAFFGGALLYSEYQNMRPNGYHTKGFSRRNKG